MTVLTRLLGEGFRIFFLSAGVFGLVALGWWIVWLERLAALPPTAAAPTLWHAHEMVFGYGAAAMGGFFLTAVPNWTGARAAKHLFIGAVAGLWALGRLGSALSEYLSPVLVALMCLSFLPVLGAKILTQLLKRPKPQNMLFLALIALMLVGEGLYQAEALGWSWGDGARGVRVGLYAICAMIAVLGGRVTPAFTRSAMLREGIETGLPATHHPFEIAGIAGAIGVSLATLFALPETLTGAIALVAGGAQLARLSGWRSGWAARQPILWALHASFAMLGIGYIALGLAGLGLGDGLGALHLLAIGAVGGMTLAMMSRATLGHSGRPLVAPAPVALAYALMPLAAALRWLANAAPGWHDPLVLAAGLAWCGALALYLAALGPVFVAPRLAPQPAE